MKRFLFLLLILNSCSKEASEPEISKYTLSVTASPSNGGLVNPTTGSYDAGSRVTILASANQFYVFNNWTGNWNGSENQVTITMDSNKTLTANFTKVDDDEDGVLNSKDSCPGTPLGSSVDENGCGGSQLDSDGDGVTDDIDQCENTSSSAALVSATGCEVPIFYLAENGVTIKAVELAEVGMQAEFNGNIYTLINEEQLRQMVNNEDNLTYIVTTRIDDMSYLFDNKLSFNQDISSWDVSNIEDMSEMFFGAKSFNQPLQNWNLLSVLNLSGMFQGAQSFNQYIGNWNFGSVTSLKAMFAHAYAFDQNISSWNVSNVRDMSQMFYKATNFDSPLNSWDVSNVTNMNSMFAYNKFNQPLSNWDVSNVEDMGGMFSGETLFQPNIGNDGIQRGSVSYDAVSHEFNQDISTWDTSNVRNMSYMFALNSKFNQDFSAKSFEKLNYRKS